MEINNRSTNELLEDHNGINENHNRDNEDHADEKINDDNNKTSQSTNSNDKTINNNTNNTTKSENEGSVMSRLWRRSRNLPQEQKQETKEKEKQEVRAKEEDKSQQEKDILQQLQPEELEEPDVDGPKLVGDAGSEEKAETDAQRYFPPPLLSLSPSLLLSFSFLSFSIPPIFLYSLLNHF